VSSEELLARILSHLTEKFKNQLILKGGILLRLMNSPRATQDIDYAWIHNKARTKKRNILGQEIKKALEELNGVEVTDVRANSRGVFLQVRDRDSGTIVKVEVGVVPAMHLPPKPISSAPLTRPYALKTQIIAAMDPAEALSHKIAATLERNLVRDLYDLAQMEPLTPFDPATLEDRLAGLEIGRAKPKKMDRVEAATLLKEKLDGLTQKRIETELSQSLPVEDLPGLNLVIRSSVSRIIQRLQAKDPTSSLRV
jgi:predicted nucleotidyltransferase component of viral defense system